jgi:tRNA threonylcarbamoyladenosine biosynthesis protein TsaB
LKLLAIETSGAACSAALLLDGALTQRLERAPRRHAELVLQMMDGLLGAAGIGLGELDALAFGRGPGSFTGVRIATAVIQGAAFGAARPVVPVSTLAALAAGAERRFAAEHMLCALDARMGEVYWGRYRADAALLTAPCGEECVAPAEALVLPSSGEWCALGSAWSAYPALAERMGERLLRIEPDLEPEAQDVARLAAVEAAAGRTVAAHRALPVYLREHVVEKKRGPPR